MAAARAALVSPATYGTTVHAILMEQYGEAVYGWEPETVSMELWDDFRVQIDAQVLEKWMALQTVISTGEFFTSVPVFSAVCNTLSSGAPSFQVFDPVTVEEAAWAVTEVALNRDMLPFGHSIKKYMRLLLANDGEADGDHPAALAFMLDPDEPNPAEAAAAALRYGPNSENADVMVQDELTGLKYQLEQFECFRPIEKVLALAAVSAT